MARINYAERLEKVRAAVAEATNGLEGEEYAEFMELLLSEADGWRMELEESEDDEDDEDEET